jgi:PUA-domain protein
MEFKIKNRHRLKKKEVREIINKLKSNFNYNFFNIDSVVEIGFYENTQFVFIENKPYFMFYTDRIVFTLSGLYKYKPNNKQVIVDMGAVKFVAKGADVMSPGIVDADKNIQPDDIVWICDEKNKKPLALGVAIISGEEMIKKEKGKAISIFHYVGDKLWDFVAKSL